MPLHGWVERARNGWQRPMSLRCSLTVVPTCNIPRMEMLRRYPLTIQLHKRLLNIPYLLLLCRGESRQLPLCCIASQIAAGFGEATLLRADLGADLADLRALDVAVDVGELGTAGFTYSVFSWALLFHVAPFPVAAGVVGSRVETHT